LIKGLDFVTHLLDVSDDAFTTVKHWNFRLS